jgi:hypothetical protein
MTAIDMSIAIKPKSDQLNADDLIAGPKTIKITRVTVRESPEQPVSIHFEHDMGKPYKPCKSMSRVLVQVWGKDGAAYVGHSMTLYRDEAVSFGGQAVGGIRISHMTGLSSPKTMSLTASRASKKPFTVQPLDGTTAPPKKAKATDDQRLAAATAAAEKLIGDIASSDDVDALLTKNADILTHINAVSKDLGAKVAAAVTAKRVEVQP